MTRKDYILIAGVVRGYFDANDQQGAYFLASAFADALERDNLQFDRAKFLLATIAEG